MYFSYKKLLDYKENRYALAKACMEYAKKVRYLNSDEYTKSGDKDSLVAIDYLLEGKIQYTLNRSEIELDLSEDSIILTSQPKEENQDTEDSINTLE